MSVDGAHLVGLMAALLIHGCYMSVFCVTMYILRTKRQISKVIIGGLICLFLLSTTNIITQMVDIYKAFVTYRVSPGTMVILDDYKDPLPVVKNLLYDVSILVADLLLGWRLHIIWPGNRLILAVVGVMITMMAGCGFFVAYLQIAQLIAGDDRYLRQSTIASIIGFCLVFITNLTVTALIAGRLWWMGRKMMALGKQSQAIYQRVIWIFASSGTIYVLFIALQVVIYGLNQHHLIYFFLRCNPSIVALFPTLVILLSSSTSMSAPNSPAAQPASRYLPSSPLPGSFQHNQMSSSRQHLQMTSVRTLSIDEAEMGNMPPLEPTPVGRRGTATFAKVSRPGSEWEEEDDMATVDRWSPVHAPMPLGRGDLHFDSSSPEARN